MSREIWQIDHDPNDAWNQQARHSRIWKVFMPITEVPGTGRHVSTLSYEEQMTRYLQEKRRQDPPALTGQEIKILWFRDRHTSDAKFLDKRGLYPKASKEGKWHGRVLRVPEELKTVRDLRDWVASKAGRQNQIGTDIYIPEQFLHEAKGSKASLGDDRLLATLPGHLLAILEELSSNGYC